MIRRSIQVAAVGLAFALLGAGCSDRASAPQTLTAQQRADYAQLAADAYVYAYPLVLMDARRKLMTDPAGEGTAPVNTLRHERKFPDVTSAGSSSPNVDTLYSSAWIDVGSEPVVLTIPNMRDRYFVVSLIDAWTNVFATYGKRAGTKAGAVAIVGPGWQGTLPDDVERVDAPTATVWLVARVLASGESEFAAVHRLQDGMALTPLSAWGASSAKERAPADTAAADGAPASSATSTRDAAAIVAAMDAPTFFGRVAELLTANPPAAADAAMVDALGRIGVEAGVPYQAEPRLLASISDGVAAGRMNITQAVESAPADAVNGWDLERDMGQFGTEWLDRARAAQTSLGSTSSREVLQVLAHSGADGRELNGRYAYTLHFDKDQIPPAAEFWSLTLYNDEFQLVENEQWRHAIGSRDRLVKNRDGSIDIHLQHQSPGGAKERNWLPTPRSGSFNLNLRLYSPEESALDGTWQPPAPAKVEQAAAS